MPAWQHSSRRKLRAVATCLFLILIIATRCEAQTGGPASEIDSKARLSGDAVDSLGSSSDKVVGDEAEPVALTKWVGLPVREITFEGVSAERLKPLPEQLPQ